jgi:hypothetical protein
MRSLRRLCLHTLGAGFALALPLGSTSHAFTTADGAPAAPASTPTAPAGARGVPAVAAPPARLARPPSPPAASRRDAGTPAQTVIEPAKPTPRAGIEGKR